MASPLASATRWYWLQVHVKLPTVLAQTALALQGDSLAVHSFTSAGRRAWERVGAKAQSSLRGSERGHRGRGEGSAGRVAEAAMLAAQEGLAGWRARGPQLSKRECACGPAKACVTPRTRARRNPTDHARGCQPRAPRTCAGRRGWVGAAVPGRTRANGLAVCSHRAGGARRAGDDTAPGWGCDAWRGAGCAAVGVSVGWWVGPRAAAGRQLSRATP